MATTSNYGLWYPGSTEPFPDTSSQANHEAANWWKRLADSIDSTFVDFAGANPALHHRVENSTQTITLDTWTGLIFGTQLVDDDPSIFTYESTPRIIRVAETSLLVVSADLVWANNSNGSRHIRIKHTDTGTGEIRTLGRGLVPASIPAFQAAAATFRVGAGEGVRIEVRQAGSGGNLDTQAGPSVQVTRLGP